MIRFAGILLLVGTTDIFPNSPLISLIDCLMESEIFKLILFKPRIWSEFSKTNPHNASVFFLDGFEFSIFIFTKKLKFLVLFRFISILFFYYLKSNWQI